MTATVVDLARVRVALARLDVIASEHPELTEASARMKLDRYVGTLDAAEPTEEAPAAEPDETG